MNHPIHQQAVNSDVHDTKEQSTYPPSKIGPSGGDIIERNPSELVPWANNPRTHSTKQLAKIKASIQKFGFTAPVLIDEQAVILSGHGRVTAAQELNLQTIPTRQISGLTQSQKRAYVIADNKISELSKWDQGLLKSEIEILIADHFEIELTGFSTAETDLMLDTGTTPVDADFGKLQNEDICSVQVSIPGDLWQLGDHRLLCGNALDPESYASLMQGELAQMVITDPPYNVAIDGHVCGSGQIKHKEFAMASGEMTAQQFTHFLSTAFTQIHKHSKDGAIVYSFMDWRHIGELSEATKPIFGPARQLCVWAKDNGGMGTFYRSQHELVFVYKKGDVPHINNFELGQHGRYRTNIWEYPGVNTFHHKNYQLLSLHPTVKPVSLIADALRDCSHRQGIVLDPFAGSGTLIIAAEQTGRYARAIELDPNYVDTAIMRWQRLTKQQAVLSASGQTWEQLRALRTAQNTSGESHGL